jgi:hypothetical protein
VLAVLVGCSEGVAASAVVFVTGALSPQLLKLKALAIIKVIGSTFRRKGSFFIIDPRMDKVIY